MISLEKIHTEMNGKLTQDAACRAFARWIGNHLEPIAREELRRLVTSSFRARKLTEHQILAAEALVLIKLDSYMNEVKTPSEGTDQCKVCSSYYRSDTLDQCFSCGCLICAGCAIYNDWYDCIDCPSCVSNLR
jgi:hypothetical protein